MKWFSTSRLLVFAGLLTLIFVEADARVGGGDSYGGGSRSYGGGSRSGGGSGGDAGFLIDILEVIIRLCFRYPKVGVPCLIIFIIFVTYYYRKNHKYDQYYSSYGTDVGDGYSTSPFKALTNNRTRDYVKKVEENDANFSFPIFKDFIFSLYHTYHEYRGLNKLDSLSAFFEPKHLAKSTSLKSIDGIVIGNCTIAKAGVNVATGDMTIEVGFSANYTEVESSGKETRYKLSETWKLKKSLKALSKPPEQMSSVACPNCGAPITETISGVCRSCNQSNKNGRFLWYVYDIVSSKEKLTEMTSIENNIGSLSLVDYGVQLPTIKDFGIRDSIERDLGKDSEYVHLRNRAEKIFMELQKSWSQQNWNLSRPFETDTLFHSHQFWIEDYKKNGQKNIIENPKITDLEPVSLFKDKYYMSFTFRIFANMVDYTLDKNGKVIRGSKNRSVKFSEYWTFIKGINTNQKKPMTNDFHLCPSCGAQLKIEMSGQCEFCGTKVTLGQFDWVLSQIEQDEEFSL